jgi:hypothetical protein
MYQGAGGPQRERDGHRPCNRLRDGSRLRDWPHLDDSGSLPVDRVRDRPHARGALLAADQQARQLDERQPAGIDGYRVLFRRAEALPGERLDLGARRLRESRQAVAVCVREPGGQFVHEHIRPMSHLGSITGREATAGLAPAARGPPCAGASPVQGMAR